MNEEASQRFVLTNELRRAVAQHAFELHFQHKLNLKTGIVEGVEALLRWPTKREAVAPNVFVPMLQLLGLIDEVGSCVVVQAIRRPRACPRSARISAWPRTSRRCSSTGRLRCARAAIVADVGAEPHRLELEVTESRLLADPRHASVSLTKLREAGVSITIDDFGTGHSSLRLLAGLPIDVLKIDGSFVRDLVTNRNHRLIVRTTIGLAESLGMKTVAEGV